MNGPVILNDLNAGVSVAMQGIALAHVAEPLVEAHLASGALETVLDDYAPTSPGMYLYYPSRSQILPKLRAFIDYMRAHLPAGQVTGAASVA